MRNYPSVGLQAPNILIPSKEVDLSKWAVVACDQFTSQPEYWQQVKANVEGSPSVFHIILPEAYLGKEEETIHQSKIQKNMREYLDQGLFDEYEGMVYVERSVGNQARLGLIAALDLDQYDFQPNSKSLIRATEGTIVDRLPPRIKIRKEAKIEIPHILVLIDDPEFKVIDPIKKSREKLQKLYDFDLMMGGGHITGYLVNNPDVERNIVIALESLMSKENISNQYQVSDEPPLLFAVGDGNHSLASAKMVWEELKKKSFNNHPARYALVELNNIHDPAIVFEAIHRLIISPGLNLLEQFRKHFGDKISVIELDQFEKMVQRVNQQSKDEHLFGLLQEGKIYLMEWNKPPHTLVVGSIQKFLNDLISAHQEIMIDYIHGDKTLLELCKPSGNYGIFLPAIDKNLLFKSVIKDGPLPKKAFSMGEAHEKRYYLEGRRITI